VLIILTYSLVIFRHLPHPFGRVVLVHAFAQSAIGPFFLSSSA